MSDPHPNKMSLRRAVWLCILAIVAPAKLAAEDGGNTSPYVIRRAFWMSLGLVVGSVAIGYLARGLTNKCFGAPSSNVVTAVQVVGAGMLLWGTLFVRGWEIETCGGNTLAEQVNQWLYRALYCAGTAIVVWSVG